MEETDRQPERLPDFLEFFAREIPSWYVRKYAGEDAERVVTRVRMSIIGRGYACADVNASLRGTDGVALEERIRILLLAARELGTDITTVLREFLEETRGNARRPRALTDRDLAFTHAIGTGLQAEGNRLAVALTN